MSDPKPRQVFSTQSMLLGSSYIINRNILLRNLMTAPLHQAGNENPTPLSNNSMDQSTGDASKKGGRNTSMKWDKRVINGVIPFVASTATAPLNRVCTLMRCQNEIVKTGRLSSPYNGIKDCFIRTIRHEGFFSLWRGNSLNVFWAMLGVSVMASAEPKNTLELKEMPSSVIYLQTMLVTGCMLPFTYAQVRLMNDVKPMTGVQFCCKPVTTTYNAAARRQFSSALDVVLKTIKCDGFGGLYRGYTPCCIGYCAYVLVKRAYDQTYTKHKQNQKTTSLYEDLAESKWMMLAVPLAAVYPLGTVARRMMTTSCEAYKYKGAMNAFFQIVRNEGVSSLYKGFSLAMVRDIARAGIIYRLIKFYKSFSETVS